MARFHIVDFEEPGVVATGKGSRNVIVRPARALIAELQLKGKQQSL